MFSVHGRNWEVYGPRDTLYLPNFMETAATGHRVIQVISHHIVRESSRKWNGDGISKQHSPFDTKVARISLVSCFSPLARKAASFWQWHFGQIWSHPRSSTHSAT